jgi:hypothetical protein
MKMDLQKLYKNRFGSESKVHRNAIWIEICRYFRRYLAKNISVIVDVAGGGVNL